MPPRGRERTARRSDDRRREAASGEVLASITEIEPTFAMPDYKPQDLDKKWQQRWTPLARL